MHKIGSIHLQSVNNNYERLQYKGMKTVRVTNLSILAGKNVLSATPQKHYQYIYTVRHKLSITQTLFQELFSCTNFFRRTTSL